MNKKAARKAKKDKLKIIKKTMGRLKLPRNQVVKDKKKENNKKLSRKTNKKYERE